jgi:hypothetical protein
MVRSDSKHPRTHICEGQLLRRFSTAIKFIILLMELKGEASEEQPTFDIIHNARSSRASRSRKSSVQGLERDRPMPKFKKLRKMTLNPESIRYQDIREME